MPWANAHWEISLQIKCERGYLIPAINTQDTDYELCAATLERSIREWHPDADITIVTRDMLPDPSAQGFSVDAQMFAVSPYRQTIKLEADMYCASSIDHWWTLLENCDVVISQGCRDFYDRPARSRHYRNIFDSNNLPDVYNAITYWRRSQTAKEFFDLVGNIFSNWKDYRSLLKFADDEATTDVVYAMAAAIIGTERVTLPLGLGPQIVHMKRRIIGTTIEDWTRELVWERTDPGLRIQTIAQWGLVHYNVKGWNPYG